MPVIELKTLKFKSSAFFGICKFFDSSVRVLQLPTSHTSI